jgi:hypothetical protein
MSKSEFKNIIFALRNSAFALISMKQVPHKKLIL